ncbi:IS1 family transposase [Enterobacter sp. CPE_E222]|uniref:IS1 family transposase n=1 Tax=Enterobacter sp. CPE_E222 TaxID=3383890 RepID=UPI003974CB6F
MLQWLLFLSAVPPVQLLTRSLRHGKSTAGHQRYLCSHCRKTWQLQFAGCRTARIMGVGLNTILRLKKLRPQSVTSRIQPGSDVIVCAEMDEQWGYVQG